MKAIAATVCALACVACDSLIGLDPASALVRDAEPGTDGAQAVEGDATTGASPGGDGGAAEAAVDAPSDGVRCTPCAGGCFDTATDDANCGSCGHSCLGAGCSGGRCQSRALVQGNPVNIAVDDAGVYWTDGVNGTVLRCAIGGCADAGDVVFDGSGAPMPFLTAAGIAVQGGQVFFAENDGEGIGNVYACPTATGCGAVAQPLFASESIWQSTTGCEEGCDVGGLAVDAANVYWSSTADNAVHSCPLGGCSSGEPTVLSSHAANAYTPWGLATGGGSLYVSIGGPFAATPYEIGWCNPDDCACSEGACPLPSPGGTVPLATAVAAGESGAYWTSAANNQIIANPLGTHSPAAASVLATVTGPGKIAVGADGAVYFTVAQPAGVYSCPAGGCDGGPTLVLPASGAVGDIAVDARRVYAVMGATRNQPLGNGSVAPPEAPMGRSIVWIAR